MSGAAFVFTQRAVAAELLVAVHDRLDMLAQGELP